MKTLESARINGIEFRLARKYLYKVINPSELSERVIKYPLSNFTEDDVRELRDSFEELSPVDVWEKLAKVTRFIDDGFSFKAAVVDDSHED